MVRAPRHMLRVDALERLEEPIRLRLRLLQRHTRPQPAERRVVPAAVARDPSASWSVPDVRLRLVAEARRHDANHRVGTIVQRDRLADRVRLSAEHAQPQAVADHRHRRRPGHALLGQEAAPERGRHADHLEEVGRARHSRHALTAVPSWTMLKLVPEVTANPSNACACCRQ